MRTREDIYRENKDVAVVLVFIVAIIAKMVEHLYLPAKYYYDNNRIFQTMLDPNFKDRWGGSYKVTADFFRRINIFNLDTFNKWSIAIAIIFNIIIIILLITSKGIDLNQTIFLLMCVGLLNIYVFNIGKEVIQIGIFTMIFLAIMLKIPNIIKVALCFGLLYWESTFFRNYYIIIAFFFITILVGILIIKKYIKKITLFKIIIIVLALYAMVSAFLFMASIFMHNDFIEVMECKNDSTLLGATSTIDDKIEHGNNIGLFMINYIINSVRMAFPIELLRAGIFYIPFIVFEGFFIYYIAKSLYRLYSSDFTQILALSIVLGYFMGSVLFEPDFGSFVRHEIATFPIIYILIFNKNNWNLKKDKGGINDNYKK